MIAATNTSLGGYFDHSKIANAIAVRLENVRSQRVFIAGKSQARWVGSMWNHFKVFFMDKLLHQHSWHPPRGHLRHFQVNMQDFVSRSVRGANFRGDIFQNNCLHSFFHVVRPAWARARFSRFVVTVKVVRPSFNVALTFWWLNHHVSYSAGDEFQWAWHNASGENQWLLAVLVIKTLPFFVSKVFLTVATAASALRAFQCCHLCETFTREYFKQNHMFLSVVRKKNRRI